MTKPRGNSLPQTFRHSLASLPLSLIHTHMQAQCNLHINEDTALACPLHGVAKAFPHQSRKHKNIHCCMHQHPSHPFALSGAKQRTIDLAFHSMLSAVCYTLPLAWRFISTLMINDPLLAHHQYCFLLHTYLSTVEPTTSHTTLHKWQRHAVTSTAGLHPPPCSPTTISLSSSPRTSPLA